MYKNTHRTVPLNTKYTDYLQKLNDDHIQNVTDNNTPPESLSPLPQSPPPQTPPSRDNIPSSGGIVEVNSMIISSVANNDNNIKSTKFADLFSPEESNALQRYLIQKASSSPNITNFAEEADTDDFIFGDSYEDLQQAKSPLTKRRRSADDNHVDLNPFGNKLRTSSESVANIVYSTIRPDYHTNTNNEPNPTNLPTGSDSKQDYDPQERIPSVDQLALRHELLNNIRAISRATYFEDLYTGKVTQNNEPPEAEIMEILQNSNTGDDEFMTDGVVEVSEDDKDERVDSWVRDSVEIVGDDDIEPKGTPLPDNTSTSLFHQSVWSPPEQQPSSSPTPQPNRVAPKGQTQPKLIPVPVPLINSSSRNASVPETKIPSTLPTSLPPNKAALLNEKRPFSFNRSSDPVIDPTRALHLLPSTYSTNRPLPFDDNILIASSTPSSTSFSRHISNHEQVQRLNRQMNRKSPLNTEVPLILPKVQHNGKNFQNQIHRSNQSLSTPLPVVNTVRKNSQMHANSLSNINKFDTHGITAKYKIPRIYQRQNMNQWVAKKVWFYINGDERTPRMEYRFRPRDLQSMDGLLNLLNKKMPQLPSGARYVFTLDGRLIQSVEELQNEQAYVVSSIRKFKPSNYKRRNAARNAATNGDLDYTQSYNHQDLHLPALGRQKSQPPPLPSIRIRKSRSIRGEKLASKSESNLSSINNLNNNNNTLGVTNENYKKSRGLSNSSMSINKIVSHLGRSEKSFSKKEQKTATKKPLSTSTSDVPRIVAGVIADASAATTRARTTVVERQMVRIINGADPSVQSQVLLNTKTSQPWEDLVKDLGMAVKLPRSRTVGNRMETLYGRLVQSYSQLRCELKVGNNAFYIYGDSDDEDDSTSLAVPNLQRHRLSLTPDASQQNNARVRRSTSHASVRSSTRRKMSLSKTLSNSSSELSNTSHYLSVPSPRHRKHRRRSQTPSHSPSLSPLPSPSTGHHSSSNTNIERRRKSVHRSRSPSPSPYFNIDSIKNFKPELSRSVHFH